MQQPHVLIHQVRPSHQILLHQALNAQGVFRVRVCQDKAELDACLSGAFSPDLLIFDHAMPTRTGIAILKRLPLACPVLLINTCGPIQATTCRPMFSNHGTCWAKVLSSTQA